MLIAMTSQKIPKLAVLVFAAGIFLFPVCSFAASVTLGWHANSESDIAQYNIYYGTSPRSYGNPIPTGKQTTYTVNNLVENETYYFALTALDTSGNESGFSSEISATATNISDSSPPSNPPPGGGAEAIVDFNADGKRDIFWHQSANGDNVVWHMDGTKRIGHSWLPALRDTLWKLAGIGDFTKDGHADILWRHSNSGELVLWHMRGAQVIGHSWLPAVTDLLWEVGGLGDFDQDGSIDILWHQRKSGQNVVWLMDGVNRKGHKLLQTLEDTFWAIGGIGDFNRDGTADILWHHKKSGQNVVWHLNDQMKVSHGSWLPKRDENNHHDWKVAGVGDLDQDGSADILWRNHQSGENDVWLMNGTVKKTTQALSRVSDIAWASNM
ncbi:MAG: FG-GAP-like repeat-containing protein [Desulfobacterales bacterium]|nr:FG-GAP-like repeat-containing protein [Desulfobacterales bacterium]